MSSIDEAKPVSRDVKAVHGLTDGAAMSHSGDPSPSTMPTRRAADSVSLGGEASGGGSTEPNSQEPDQRSDSTCGAQCSEQPGPGQQEQEQQHQQEKAGVDPGSSDARQSDAAEAVEPGAAGDVPSESQPEQGSGPAAPVAAVSDEEALVRAEGLKREGNELFGRGLWDEAAAKYNEALDAAPASAPREQAIYFANLAACNIKTQQYAAAVQNCTEALRLDPSYQKAYMRRCEAYERLDELDHALGDARKLAELDPGSGWALGKVAALQPVVDERAEKLKTEMLSKLKELGNTVLGKFGMSTDNFKFDQDPATGGYNIRFQR